MTNNDQITMRNDSCQIINSLRLKQKIRVTGVRSPLLLILCLKIVKFYYIECLNRFNCKIKLTDDSFQNKS